MSSNNTIVGHSWVGVIAHIPRTNGSIIRARLGNIEIRPYHIGVRVHFRSKNRAKTKLVSPLSIVALQVLWLNRDVVSDAECEKDDIYNHAIDILPPLRVPTVNKEHHQALIWLIAQCEALSNILGFSP